MRCDNCGGHELVFWTVLRSDDGAVYPHGVMTGFNAPPLCTVCREAVAEALAERAKKVTPADAEVLDAINCARGRVGLLPLSAAARTTKKIAARRKAGASQQELLDVVDAFGRLALRDPSKRTILNAITPFTGPSGRRNGGWHWGLQLAAQYAEDGRVRGVVPKTVAEIEEERAR